MKVTLGTRTAGTVAVYFRKTNHEAFRRVLPQKAKTVEEAIRDYELSLLPGAASYGRIILADGQYVGDIWCYSITLNDVPNAMVSYCVFEPAYWNQGIATEAVRLFIDEIAQKHRVKTIGAFTFSDNLSSIRVLEKNRFKMVEEFFEEGVSSKYFQFER